MFSEYKHTLKSTPEPTQSVSNINYKSIMPQEAKRILTRSIHDSEIKSQSPANPQKKFPFIKCISATIF